MVLPYSPPSPLMQPPGAMMPVPAGLPGGLGPSPSPLGPPSQIIDADFRLLVTAEEGNLAPPPPPWYVPGSEPNKDDIKTEADEQKQNHYQRVLTQAWMDMLLGMEISAIFNSDQLFVEVKEIEPQPSQLLQIMNAAIVNFIAAQTISFTSLATGLVNREERAAIEAKLSDSLIDWRTQHFREGQGDLIRVLTSDALSGMVAIYHAPDPGNKRSGQRRYRVDPKVVFPVFGRDGLDRVYTCYEATYPEVLRDFGDGPNGEATKAIQKIARKGQGRGARTFDLDTQREVTGYWDREHGIVLWNGEVIRRWHHKLWVCPWHVFVPNWRNASGMKTNTPYLWQPGGNAPTDENGLALTGSTRERDLAKTFEPFLMPWVATKDKFEKLLTRYMYAADRALANPKVHKRSQANSDSGSIEIQNFRDGTTEIMDDEELDFLPNAPMQESFAPLWEMLSLELKAAIPVQLLQGQTIGTQTSGNAIDAIHEMGFSHFSPVVQFMPQVFAETGHRELYYHQHFAPAYDPGDPVNGGFPIPTAASYTRGPAKLTREMLERAGCYVQCDMARFSLTGAVPAITAAAQLKVQLGLGDDDWYIRRLGMSTNPRDLIESRRVQDMEMAPGYVEAAMIQYLYEQMEKAAEMGDDESLRRLMILAKRVSAKQTAHDMQIAKMIGMMPPQPEPMAGELPGNAGTPGGNPMPYMSAPQVARSTGVEGGAPSAAPPIPGQQ